MELNFALDKMKKISQTKENKVQTSLMDEVEIKAVNKDLKTNQA